MRAGWFEASLGAALESILPDLPEFNSALKEPAHTTAAPSTRLWQVNFTYGIAGLYVLGRGQFPARVVEGRALLARQLPF